MAELAELGIAFPFDEKNFNDFARIMSMSIQVPDEAISNEIAEWIMHGTTIHEMNKVEQICEFCGNVFDGPKIAQIIQSKTSTEHAKFIKDLENIHKKITIFDSNLLNLHKSFKLDELFKINEVLLKKLI